MTRETAKNLTKEFKNKYASINWSEIIRTRDKIRPNYFGVNLEIVWDIIKKDIPNLKKRMLQIISQENNN